MELKEITEKMLELLNVKSRAGFIFNKIYTVF